MYAWIVVIRPCSMPTASWTTFANGARQFVVHDAFEMTSCESELYLSKFTPRHDGDVLVGRGRGDDDLLRAGVEVLGGTVALREEAGRLEHDVDAEVAPAERGGIALLLDEDRRAVDDEAVVGELDGARVGTEDRVVAQEVRERRIVGEVVDGDPLDVGLGRLSGAEHVAADAAEAVDSNTYGHAE